MLKIIKYFFFKWKKVFLFLLYFFYASCHSSSTQEGQAIIAKAASAHDLRVSDGLFLYVPGVLMCLVKVLSSFSYLTEKFLQEDARFLDS